MCIVRTMHANRIYGVWLVCLLFCGTATAAVRSTDQRPYVCEFGVQGGIGYYCGDAAEHVFTNVRETYGGHFRYKFDPRWALQVKGLYHLIQGPMPESEEKWKTHMVNVDAMAEFNFIRFGRRRFDRKMKPYTPYIFAGVGMSLYGESFDRFAVYIPVGIGFKWKFAEHWGMNIAWQHNIYTVDNLECRDVWGNTWDLNGSNWLNCDVTGQLTLGIVFEFGKLRKPCKTCQY